MLTGLQKSKGRTAPRRNRLIGSVIAAFLIAPLAAEAQDICETLEAQLRQPAESTQVIGTTAQVRQFANALTQQNLVIRRIKNDLRSYGCSSGSVIVYGNPNAQICGDIADALAQAEAERDMIAQDRNRMLASRRTEAADRWDRIMAALDAEGCLDRRPPDYASTDPGLDAQPRGYTDPFNDNQRDIGNYGPTPDMPTEGGLRTLCVRTCDGAFFPISSNATPMDFGAQAAQCERMCPGTETELFYHSMVGQESSDMVSAKTGQPYKSMPTAFAYRNGSPATRSPSCSCNMAAYHQEMKKQNEQASAPQSSPDRSYSGITRIPAPKTENPKPASPEPAPQVEAKAPPAPERDYDPKNSKVRIVGPQFLPEETSRIDLKNPALKGAQPQQE
ncbi:DUF2865 domain-containing protein [Agrobacterium sp. SORGH_AS 787]|uniref:DUF2865 domain-containing protein n=1 Tax=Agrobacterium sp. SORGH_AS 787 TaxID=3041775 RepID=UPI00277D47E9|nr:hypothetical protein [Rhizobium sp. SORGH_AS_0787]